MALLRKESCRKLCCALYLLLAELSSPQQRQWTDPSQMPGNFNFYIYQKYVPQNSPDNILKWIRNIWKKALDTYTCNIFSQATELPRQFSTVTCGVVQWSIWVRLFNIQLKFEEPVTNLPSLTMCGMIMQIKLMGCYSTIVETLRNFISKDVRKGPLAVSSLHTCNTMGWFVTARVRSTTEGYSFTLLVCSRGGESGPAARGRGQVQLPGGGGGGSGPAAGGGGVRSSCQGGSGPAAGGVRSSSWGGVRSSCRGEGSGPAARGGQVQWGGG